MSSAKGRPTGSGVQSIDRAAAILEAFADHAPSMGVTEVAAVTRLSTSTVHRLLSALEHHGLVRQTPDRRYVLGPSFLRLAHSAATNARLRDLARPVMEELRDRVEETVGLHELAGPRDRVTIAQAESHLALRRTYTELGTPIPLPQGAPGKALLAYMPAAQLEDVLGRPLVAITEATITDADTLRMQLEETRRAGYAISLGERTPGIRSVAAPIWDYTGNPIACLSISAPELRMPVERCHELGEQVKIAACEVSRLLGSAAAVERIGDT